MAKAKSGDLISMLEPYFTKQAPFQIPKKWRESLVNWIPWINLVIGILLLPAVLVVVGVSTIVGVVAPAVGVSTGIFYWFSILLAAVTIALLFVTFPGLRARKLSAWKLVFWADIIFFAYGVASALSTGNLMDIVMQFIGTAAGLYVLFQIKSYYK